MAKNPMKSTTKNCLQSRISQRYHLRMTTETTKSNSNLKPFLVRLRPDTRMLLDEAAGAERRSRASIIDEALRNHLAGYERVQDRLDALLGKQTP
jgi:hypothetical protein